MTAGWRWGDIMKALNDGRPRVRRWIFSAVAAALTLTAGALGWSRSRPVAPESAAPSPPIVAVPIHDTATEIWRVVPSPSPPRPVRRAPAKPAPVAELDWSALSVEVADPPTGEAVSLAGPAELSSGLSRSERERLIAAGDDRTVSPNGYRRGTVVIGRGTPRRGRGRGRCD